MFSPPCPIRESTCHAGEPASTWGGSDTLGKGLCTCLLIPWSQPLLPTGSMCLLNVAGRLLQFPWLLCRAGQLVGLLKGSLPLRAVLLCVFWEGGVGWGGGVPLPGEPSILDGVETVFDLRNGDFLQKST